MGTLQSLYTGDNVDCVVNGVATKPVYLRRGLRQGCSLSPMLFALYIADIGDDINASGMGFNLGSICISGLLFADDIIFERSLNQTFILSKAMTFAENNRSTWSLI